MEAERQHEPWKSSRLEIERAVKPNQIQHCQRVEAEGQNCLKCWVQNVEKREAQVEFKVDVNSR